MKNKTALSIALLCPLAFLAADSVTPLSVQPGLWEISITSQASGVSQDTLMRLPPDQRAKIQAASKASPPPRTHRTCLTPADLQKPLDFGDQNKAACKRTVVTATGTVQEYSMECSNGPMKSTGNVHIEALSPISFRGQSQMESTDGARKVDLKVAIAGRWLGEQCGEFQKK